MPNISPHKTAGSALDQLWIRSHFLVIFHHQKEAKEETRNSMLSLNINVKINISNKESRLMR